MECHIFLVHSLGFLHLRLERVAFEAGDRTAPSVVKIEREFNQDLNTSSYEVIFRSSTDSLLSQILIIMLPLYAFF